MPNGIAGVFVPGYGVTMAEESSLSETWVLARLRTAATELGMDPDQTVPSASGRGLLLYGRRFLEWGARVNLTGAGNAAVLVDEHFSDALPILPHLPDGPFRGIDVGSGGGLPGVVLAVLRPDSHWTLLEPIQKRHAFLNQVRRDLAGSAQLECVRGRVEDLKLAGTAFDCAISRAVWPAAEWLEIAQPLLAPGGRAIGLRTADGAALPSGTRAVPYALGGKRREVLILDG